MRKRIIKAVLTTDMAKHEEDLKLLKLFLSNPDCTKNKLSEKDKIFLMGMSVHVADISNPSKNWLV